MAKTAITKRKNGKISSIRTRLTAAICMLLISSIMLVSSTYAWFTLSTAPEVKGINNSVAGNGSLEVALMPGTGLLSSITTGRSGTNGGGTVQVTTANNTWGNLITLSDPAYGLQTIELRPMSVTEGENSPLVFGIPEFGYDGRITTVDPASMGLNSFENNTAFTGEEYGVRAIVSEGENDTVVTYGYVIDLAFRTNATNNGTAAKLILQKNPTQRVYTDSTSEITEGGGSSITFGDNSLLSNDAIRIAFIQNFGRTAEGNETTVDSSVLAYAKADAAGKLQLFKYVEDETTNEISEQNIEDNALLAAMDKNTVYQISAVVWLDASNLKNEDFISTDELTSVTLNLQFATDVTLVPSLNSALRDNPPAPVNNSNGNEQGG